MRYIGPCCVQNQIPAMLEQWGPHFFWTCGDVTFEHFMKNLGCVTKGMKTVVVVKERVNVYDCRLLAWFLGHGDWWNALLLVTKEDCQEMVDKELGGYKDMVEYRCVKNMGSECVVQWNEEGESVMLMGKLTQSVRTETQKEDEKKKDNTPKDSKEQYTLARAHTQIWAYDALFGVWMTTRADKCENKWIRDFFKRYELDKF